MVYRVELDISFIDKNNAEDLINYVENLKNKGYNPKDTERIPVRLTCRYHACTHDEANPVQCKDYVNIDFNSEKKVHKL